MDRPQLRVTLGSLCGMRWRQRSMSSLALGSLPIDIHHLAESDVRVGTGLLQGPAACSSALLRQYRRRDSESRGAMRPLPADAPQPLMISCRGASGAGRQRYASNLIIFRSSAIAHAGGVISGELLRVSERKLKAI